MEAFILVLTITAPWGLAQDLDVARFYGPVLALETCEAAGPAVAAQAGQKIAETFGIAMDVTYSCRRVVG